MSDYKNKNYGRRSREEDSPVTFRDGEPVFRSDKKRSSFGRSYDEGGQRSYGERKNRRSYEDRPYGEDRYSSDKKRKYDDDRYSFDKKKKYDDDKYSYDKKKKYDDDKYSYDKKKKYDDDKYSFDKKKKYDDDKYADKKRKYEEKAERTEKKEVAPEDLPYILMGRNAVREAIKAGRSIDRILVVEEQDGSLGEIINMARDRNLIIREVDRKKLDEMCMPFGHGDKPGNHQGIVAQVPGVEYCDVGDILALAKERGEDPFVILLDGVEDPHNLGSIIRSAECAGAHGVVITKRRSASVTAAVAKASAGAVEYMKVAKVANLGNAIERLKQDGLWVAGADMAGEAMNKVDLSGPLALVIGSEGDGLSRLVKEKCDFLVSIPIFGHVDSLNAAVAAAVLMYQKRGMDAAKK